MRVVFGGDVDFALCAYRPRFERIPKQAAIKALQMSVACLTPEGVLEVSPWTGRAASAKRAPYAALGACVFAFRYPPVQTVRPNKSREETPEAEPEPLHESQRPCSGDVRQPTEQCVETLPKPLSKCATAGDDAPESVCDCCLAAEPTPVKPEASPELEFPDSLGEGIEAVYEELDWVTLEHLPMPSTSRRAVARQVEGVRRVPFQLALSALREDSEGTERELREWLGVQGNALGGQVGLIEVFTGKAPLSSASSRTRGLVSIRLGLEYGQDFSRARDRRLLLLLLGRCRARDVWFSWPCSCWSGWSRMSLAKGGNSAAKILSRRKREQVFLRLFEQAWALQLMLGGHAHAENPQGSAAWRELTLGPAFEADFHMCAAGMTCPDSGLPILRPTRVVSSDAGLVQTLMSLRCPGHTRHAHLEGSRQTRIAEVYPRKLCSILARYFSSRDEDVHPDHDIFLNTEDEADSERESENEVPEGERPRPNRAVYPAMIQKLHVNTGHSSVPQMLRLAQRARAPEGVIRAIRDFKCPICEELQVPPSHRVAALKHTETPNQIVGLDVVQVELKRDGPEGVEELKFNVLTAVDYASDFAQQIVIPSRPGSVSRAFHELWCRPYGPPKTVYVDPDQRWMSCDFQEYLRHNSIALLNTATESHWQLGRVEIAQKNPAKDGPKGVENIREASP